MTARIACFRSHRKPVVQRVPLPGRDIFLGEVAVAGKRVISVEPTHPICGSSAHDQERRRIAKGATGKG
jgi:hypothetical protein